MEYRINVNVSELKLEDMKEMHEGITLLVGLDRVMNSPDNVGAEVYNKMLDSAKASEADIRRIFVHGSLLSGNLMYAAVDVVNDPEGGSITLGFRDYSYSEIMGR